MADAIWYYAQDDREHGPVTASYIAGMARTGKLRPDDLVWREGMEDWRPARVVKGLFGPQGERPASPSSDTAVLDAPLERAAPPTFEPEPPPEAGTAPHSELSPPSDASASVLQEPPPPPVVESPSRFRNDDSTAFDAEPPVASAPDSLTTPAVSRSRSQVWNAAPAGHARSAARLAMCLGLLLVLFARGCENLAARYVARLEAQAQQASASNAAREGQPVAASSNAQEGELAKAATNARWRQVASGYWREMVAFSGAILLALGSCALIFLGRRAERWLGMMVFVVLLLSFLHFSPTPVDSGW